MAEVRVQDPFLERLIESQKVITVILLNGYQIRGTIKAFDQYMIEINSLGEPHHMYKHAISTIKEG